MLVILLLLMLIGLICPKQSIARDAATEAQGVGWKPKEFAHRRATSRQAYCRHHDGTTYALKHDQTAGKAV
jgi:hypothetical protein